MHTCDTVLKAFQLALVLARRLPADVPSPWPGILWFGYEGHSQKAATSSPLTPKELADYQTISPWINFIKDEPSRFILWAYASGIPHTTISERYGPKITPTMIARRVMWALGFITWKLNDGQQPPAIALPVSESET
jgi:hypothetical protein